MKIVITGAAGYIGGMIIEKLAADPSVSKIIGIDRAARPAAFEHDARITAKLEWITADLADADSWTAKVPATGTGKDLVVIHSAFIIRNPYGAARTKAVEKNNLDACRNVFRFAFARNAARLVYLGSVASYGAKPSNVGRLLDEQESLSETVNPYGWQKAESERVLAEELARAKAAVENGSVPALRTQAFVVRLNSVTGPRGQSMESKFGLITFLRKLLPFIIRADRSWARQYVHENDVRDAILALAAGGIADGRAGSVEAFNIAPPQFLTAQDMARILHKAILPVPRSWIKPLFAVAWHATHGKMPTRPDSAEGLIWPINVDGSKIEKKTPFRYRHTAEDAFLAKE